MDTPWHPSGASMIIPNATGVLRDSGGAVTSGMGATLPRPRDTGLGKAGGRTTKGAKPRKAWEGVLGWGSGREA